MYQVAGAATTRFAYDGANAIADYDGSNALQHRYVFGPGIDQPIVQYDASGNRAFLGTDERGSIVSLTDSSGNLINLNRYDEYGKPQSTNAGRFQYTGQMWLGEVGAYYYKARVYLPHLGIFAQTDPVGADGGINLYVYTGNDPVNWIDPLGLCPEGTAPAKGVHGRTETNSAGGPEIVAPKCKPIPSVATTPGASGGGGGVGGGGGGLRQRILENIGLHKISCSQALKEQGMILAVAADVVGIEGTGANAQGGYFEICRRVPGESLSRVESAAGWKTLPEGRQFSIEQHATSSARVIRFRSLEVAFRVRCRSLLLTSSIWQI